MRFLSRIRIKSVHHFNRVIGGCFVVLLALMLILSADNYYNLSSLGGRLSEVVNEYNEKTVQIYNLRGIARERMILLHRVVQETDPFVIDDQILRHHKLAGDFVRLRQDLEKKLKNEREIREFGTLREKLKLAQPAQLNVISFVQENRKQLAIKALDKAVVAQDNVIEQLQLLADMQREYSHILSENTESDLAHAYFIMVLITLIVILVAALTSCFVVRVINSQNDELKNVNQTIELTNRTLEGAIVNAVNANKAKSEFIANMSHELRTPMTSIRGALGMLNSGMVDNIPDDAKTMINIADTNSERLMELISDVLDFSQFEADEIELIHREFNVKNEMEKILIPFYLKAKKKGLALEIYYETHLPDSIITDLEHIKHIIVQLMNNAIKFTEKGCVEVHMDLAEKSSVLMVSVRDTGIGVNENELSHIFEKFVQSDGSSTRKYGGTGIGLAICQKLVNALGGEMGVESKLGEGSVFWFTIPLEQQQDAA